MKQFDVQLDAALADVDRLRERLVSMKQKLNAENPVRDVLMFFNELWCAKYAPGDASARYDFTKDKDPGNFKRLLKTHDVATMKGRITRFFADRDDWIAKQCHSTTAFFARINTYGAVTSGRQTVGASAPADCRHKPPCKTDKAHTDRRNIELRSGIA